MSGGSPTLGMGFCPLGFSLFGFGSPATLGMDQGFTLQENVNGVSRDARNIDQFTRDYVIDTDGIVQGQSAIAQQVFLAVSTTLGSSVVQELGSQFSNVKTFDASTFKNQMTNIVQQCLADLIKNGSITLVDVVAQQNSNGIAGNVFIQWLDNTTQQINQIRI